jgi:hypothetical protein
VKWLAVIIVALACGCSDPADTQFLPIGSRCSSSAQCGTAPYACNMGPGYNFGYCEKPCSVDGECPLDSLCAPAPLKVCRRACKATSECRDTEGYACVALTTGKTVCDTAPATATSVDGGGP